MNITRFALSITLLTSFAFVSAQEEVNLTSSCEVHGCKHTPVADIVKQATQDFTLTEDEAAQLTARLEATDADLADIAAMVAEIRTQNSEVTAEQKTAEVTELI